MNLASNQRIGDIQRTIHIVKTDNAAHIIVTYYNAGNRPHLNALAVAVKYHFTIVISCQASGTVPGSLPFVHDHLKNETAVIGKIAGAILYDPICSIIAYDTADIAVVTCSHSIIDAIGDSCKFRTVILTYNTAYIPVADYVSPIGCYLNARRFTIFPCNCFLQDIGQASGDASHIIGAQHITSLPGTAPGQLAVVSITDDTAYIMPMKQFILFCIIKIFSVLGSIYTVDNPHPIAIAKDTAEIAALQPVIFLFIVHHAKHKPVINAIPDADQALRLCSKVAFQCAHDSPCEKVAVHIPMVCAFYQLHIVSAPGIFPNPGIAKNPADSICIILGTFFCRRCARTRCTARVGASCACTRIGRSQAAFRAGQISRNLAFRGKAAQCNHGRICQLRQRTVIIFSCQHTGRRCQPVSSPVLMFPKSLLPCPSAAPTPSGVPAPLS